uniref:DIX domain-containing protein n=1 Tax=Meloidogyne enterolobii TaxID=390850 RepID=A0A6V7UIB8_MELEN|nr:unnamed protein product [Meloidogyne enterolobii]
MENKENNNSENISSLKKEEENKMETENVENIEEHEPLTTKVYYYVDDQKMPYSTEVPVPPSKITLYDFKNCITKRSYKYYCKVVDAELNAEVKAEIRDEYECLKPCANGRFELFLLSDNGCGRTIQRPIDQKHHHHGFAQRQVLAPSHFQSQKNCGVRASMMAGKRPASHYIMEHSKFVEGDSSPEEENTNNQLFGESNFASSLSDGDSQYTTDFTSVSQQNHFASRYALQNQHNNKVANSKPYWTREKRKRYRRQRSPPSSFLSSTFDDTEVSMSVDVITVTFNMDTRRPFGMSVVVKRNRYFYGIVVHEVSPRFILLEINGISLDEYETPEAAVNVLSTAVRQAVESRGQLKLTCSRGDVLTPAHNIFRPPQSEPVRPIDPTAWVQHTNAARGLDALMIAPPVISPSMLIPTKTSIYANAMAAANNNNNNIIAAVGKAAVINSTNYHQQQQQHFIPQQQTQQQQIITSDGLKLIKNPSTEITTSSGNSSLECSIGQKHVELIKQQQTQQHEQHEQQQLNLIQTCSGKFSGKQLNLKEEKKQTTTKTMFGGGKKVGGGGGGGIGNVLRRLLCVHSSASPQSSSDDNKNKKKNIKRSASNKEGKGKK